MDLIGGCLVQMLECWFDGLNDVFYWNPARCEGEIQFMPLQREPWFPSGLDDVGWFTHNDVLCEGHGTAEMGLGSKRLSTT